MIRVSVPALYERMYNRGVFTVEEAAEALDQRGARLYETLSRLSAEGYLSPVRRGLYAVVPLNARGEEPVVNPYLVASKLARPYVLGYHTALELHGAAHSSFHQAFVASPASFRTFTHQGITYRRVAATGAEVEKSRTMVVVEGQDVHVAKREWALVRCAHRLDLSGGLEELLRSVEAIPSLNLAEVHDALRTLGYATLYNRVGFILSRYRKLWRVSDADLAELREHVSAHRQYFGAGPPREWPTGGRLARPRANKKVKASATPRAVFVQEWNVLVPEHLAGGEPVAPDAA